ncbi:MAG: hypothetical protein HYY01_14360 [Chloroflexi bacterium]|nr:hypothetical protein [Chloroflexota bacterium]
MRRQEGFILPWAMMVILLGVFIAVPVIGLAGNAFRGHARIEDQIRSFYAADATVHAVMSDLARGSDAAPSAPFTYSPPAVNFGTDVPQVSVNVLESQTLATVKPINYLVDGNPTVLVGVTPIGTGLDLASDDDSYYKLSDAGTPPSLSYEVTSQPVQFAKVSFGEVRITALSTKSSAKLEVFIYNPADPAHTQNGYNPIADMTVILELANTEQTFSVSLEDADVTYLNSLSTKRLKIKVVATRTGGFRLDTDQLVFAMAGVVSTDQVNVQGEPLIITGSLLSGSGAALRLDDTTYYTVSSLSNVVMYQVTSSNLSFSSLDKVTVPLVVRANKGGVVLELFVFNPTDPAHTSGGYDPTPDLTTTIPLNNVDKAVTLTLSQADVAYLNTLSPISMKLKVRASYTSAFQLESDMLLFIATSNSAPAVMVRQISQQYVDPGLKNPNFSTMVAKEGYLLRIYNVRPGLLMVNWASHTPDFKEGKTSIQVFRGLVIDSGALVTPGKITSKPSSSGNDLVLAASSRPHEAFVRTGFVDVDTGVYTIVFFNDSASTMITEPFAATGNKEDAWIYVPAFKDYLVDVQVGKVGLKAVVRQIPGPTEPPDFPWSTTNINWIENLVLIQSWEPYGVVPPLPAPSG